MSTQADITLAAFNLNQTLTTTIPTQINTLLNAIVDQNTINTTTHRLDRRIIAQINEVRPKITEIAATLSSLVGASAV